MNKIINKVVFLLLLMTTIAYAKTPDDTVVINRILMTPTLEKIIYGVYAPGRNVNTFTNKNKRIFYYVHFGIINPTKKKYQIEMICVDSKDNVIFKASVSRTLVKFPDYIGEDSVKNQEQILGLDPKPGAMIEGQLMPLKSDEDYFIKLYIENKLVGISSFTYRIDG